MYKDLNKMKHNIIRSIVWFIILAVIIVLGILNEFNSAYGKASGIKYRATVISVEQGNSWKVKSEYEDGEHTITKVINIFTLKRSDTGEIVTIYQGGRGYDGIAEPGNEVAVYRNRQGDDEILMPDAIELIIMLTEVLILLFIKTIIDIIKTLLGVTKSYWWVWFIVLIIVLVIPCWFSSYGLMCNQIQLNLIELVK